MQENLLKGYGRETVKAIDICQTSRGVKAYSLQLGFEKVTDFLDSLPKETSILDLGSGEGLFAKSLFLLRPDVTVVNVNPRSIDMDFRKLQKNRFIGSMNKNNNYSENMINKAQERHDTRAVCGLNPHLPFKKESFDIVLDLMASIYYAQISQYTDRLREISRVLKPGGKSAVGKFVTEEEKDVCLIKLMAIKEIDPLKLSAIRVRTDGWLGWVVKFTL